MSGSLILHKKPVYSLQLVDGKAPELLVFCGGMSTDLFRVAGSWVEALLERDSVRERETSAVTAEQCFPQLPDLWISSLFKTKVFSETR